MITSQKQLTAAKEKIRLLQEGLAAPPAAGTPAILVDAARGQVEELVAEIEAEIREYETLQEMKADEFRIESLDDLMDAPIRYRLANKMTIEEFAHKVGIHSRQIARYEAQRYRNLTTSTLLKILDKLGIQISGRVRMSA